MFCQCCCAAEVENAHVVDLASSAAIAEELFPSTIEPAEGESRGRFQARLTRSSPEAPWGLKVDFADDRTVHVCAARQLDTPLQAYNEHAAKDQQICVGDYFLSVNGVSAATVVADASPTAVAEALRAEMKTTSIDLVVVRPQIFEVVIHKDGTLMGLELNFTHRSTSLVVVKVTEGAVQSCAPEVIAGDRIIEADGQEGSPEQLLEAIRLASGSLKLKLTRPAEQL